jgi:hypothetical protein
MKKKTTERPGVPALSPKDTRSDHDDDDDDETLRASFDSKQQTRKQKEIGEKSCLLMKIPRSVHRPQR